MSARVDEVRLSGMHPMGAVVFAVALLCLLLLGLGRAPLFDVDEGAFAEATREMLVSGDWGHTTLNGADRFDKPIGVYWLQALSATLFGTHEFAVRLPSVLATWLGAMALWQFVAPRWGGSAGVMAAVIHATGLGTWAMAHAATADALLGLCLLLSALDLWRYLESQERNALLRLSAWVGLGLLVKGPVALLLPAASLLLCSLIERQWSPFWRALADLRAWASLLLLALPWYAYAFWRHGQAFFDGFFLKHNIDRFAAPMEGHAGGGFYFLLVIPLLWMPWTPLLLAWWGRAGEVLSDVRVRRAAVWLLFVLVFFSFSSTKLPHYGLYAAPGVVILLVAALNRPLMWLWKTCACALLMWHALMVGLPWAWTRWPDLAPSALANAMAGSNLHIPLLPILAIWCLPAFAFLVLRRRHLNMRPELLVAFLAMLHAGVMAWVVWPWWANTLQGPIKTLATVARNWPGSVSQLGGNWPSFAFYRQEALTRDPSKADLLLLPVQQASHREGWEPLARVQGMVLLRKSSAQGSP